MKYIPPFGTADENAAYINGSPEHGIEGSVVPAECIEHPQREILEVIRRAGLTPSGDNLAQLWEALNEMIRVKVPLATLTKPGLTYPDGSTCTVDAAGMLTALPNGAWRNDTSYIVPCLVLHSGRVWQWLGPSGPAQAGVGPKEPGTAGAKNCWLDYAEAVEQRMFARRIGQYEWWEDDLARPGFEPCLGGVITNFSTRYPSAAAYFTTEHGAKRLVTKAEYDALHVHVWHTNADGSKVSWNGIGGVNAFVWDEAADTLTLPDLAGMSPEMIGDGLDLGESQGDAARRTVGSFQAGDASTHVTGPFSWSRNGTATVASGSAPWNVVVFDTYRTGPVGPKNQTRAWGSLACVYLGLPAS